MDGETLGEGSRSAAAGDGREGGGDHSNGPSTTAAAEAPPTTTVDKGGELHCRQPHPCGQQPNPTRGRQPNLRARRSDLYGRQLPGNARASVIAGAGVPGSFRYCLKARVVVSVTRIV